MSSAVTGKGVPVKVPSRSSRLSVLRLVRMAVAFVVVAGSLGLATVAATAQSNGGSCPSDGADAYSDVSESSFAYDDSRCLRELGISDDDENYRPSEDMTRSEMAAFMANAYAALTGMEAPVEEHMFEDVADDPNADDIARISPNGLMITEGTSDTTYSPDAPVVRGHMALFLTRLYSAATGSDAPAGDTPFTDIGDRPAAEQAAIGALFALKVTKGTSDTTYSPHSNVTREQMASFVARMYRAIDATPGVPTGLTASASGTAGTALDISWDASDGADSYVVQWKASDASAYNDSRTVTGTSTTVGGLTSGTSYTFRVAASGGAWSDEVTATPSAPATVPGAVNDFVATTGNTTLTLSWAPPTDDGGSPITGYKIQLSKNREAPQTIEVGAVTTHTVTGLDNTADYRVFIQAVNDVGEGTITPLTSPTSGLPGVPVRPGPAPADAPQELTLAQKRDPATQQPLAGVDISWSTPSVGSTSLASYMVQARCGAATDWTTTVDYNYGNRVTEKAEIDATDAPLGTSCDVRVQSVPAPASNSYAYASITLTGALPAALAAAPTVTPFNKSLLVSWTNPTGTNNTGYKVAWSSGTPIGDHTVDARTSSYTITGLTNGRAYSVTVSAVNANGTGPATAAVAETPAGVPSAPTNVRATLPSYSAGQTVPYGGSTLNVSWSAPASNNSNPVSGYEVQARTSPTAMNPAGGEWGAAGAAGTVNVGARTVQITGLTNSESYDVRVRASNSNPVDVTANLGPWSSTFATATPVAPVVAPGDVAAEIVSNRMTITWNPQSASNVTGYQLRYGVSPGGTWTTVNAAATDVRKTVGVSPNSDYDFQIRTKFAIGGVTDYSVWTAEETTSTAEDADNPRTNGPSAPATVTATVVAPLTGADPTLSVTWSRVVHSNVNGARVSGYELASRVVTADPTDTSSWTSTEVVSAAEAAKLTKTITGTAGMKYEVRVRATATSSAAGAPTDAIKGAWQYSSVVTARAIPAAPAVGATVSLIPDGPVTVTWTHAAQTAAPGAPGSDVTGYVVTWWRTTTAINLPGGSATSVMVDGRDSKSYSIPSTGLIPGTYAVNVQAVNDVGNGVPAVTQATFNITP